MSETYGVLLPVDLLRRRLGVKGSEPNPLLAHAYDVAQAWIAARVYDDCREPDVIEATLILASRLYARRNSPEGVAGWGDLGVVRIIASDPDIESLLERHIDMMKTGMA